MSESTAKRKPAERPQGAVRFVRSITLRNGRVIHAEDYGHKAFPIRARSGSLRRQMTKKR